MTTTQKTQQPKFTLTKDGFIKKNGVNVSQLVEKEGEWTAIGWFGEVYASGTDRKKVALQATKDQRLGKIPAAAAR